MQEEIYEAKDIKYFQNIRYDIVSLVPESSKRILEVGCGTGETGYILKQKLNAEVIGIELFTDAAKIASNRLDRVIIGNIETLEFDFKQEYFDCIIFPDVLEHCINPWKVLESLKQYLKPNGITILSIPNLRYLKPLLKIIFNKFEYEKDGVLDKTHLRFFTLFTIKKMLNYTGLDIIKIKRKKGQNWVYYLFNIFTLGLLTDFTTYQYLIIAKKK
jgi:2-polyprenyl-3-methyl-5-hydroxy-6-metoxy-1,4-benzoquinol methylase